MSRLLGSHSICVYALLCLSITGGAQERRPSDKRAAAKLDEIARRPVDAQATPREIFEPERAIRKRNSATPAQTAEADTTTRKATKRRSTGTAGTSRDGSFDAANGIRLRGSNQFPGGMQFTQSRIRPSVVIGSGDRRAGRRAVGFVSFGRGEGSGEPAERKETG